MTGASRRPVCGPGSAGLPRSWFQYLLVPVLQLLLVSSVLGWGFFLSDRAGSRVLLGVPAEACGLRQPPELAVPGHIPLSPGHSSLRPRSLELARSPQRPQRRPIQIKGLRADESICWIATLAGGRERTKLSLQYFNLCCIIKIWKRA